MFDLIRHQQLIEIMNLKILKLEEEIEKINSIHKKEDNLITQIVHNIRKAEKTVNLIQ